MVSIDLSYLEEITGNDKSMIHEMLGLFISDIPTQVAKIRNHADNKELTGMAKEAHKIKATLQYVGLNEMSSIMKQLEEYGRSGDYNSEIPIILERLEKMAEVAVPLLKEKRKELS